MPTFQFEAMDATGQEIKDVIDAATEEEAQTTIRQMGYYVTKISVKRSGADDARLRGKSRRSRFVMGGASTKVLTTFTRQLSILQEKSVLPLHLACDRFYARTPTRSWWEKFATWKLPKLPSKRH